MASLGGLPAISRPMCSTPLLASPVTLATTSRRSPALLGHKVHDITSRHVLPTPSHLDEIDRRVIGEFVSARKSAGISDSTIRSNLAYVSSLCAMAIRWGWLGTNPVTAMNKRSLQTSQRRTRFLTPSELDQLLAATASHIRPAIILATETGMRKEELFGLTLSRIDLARREIILDVTKSGMPRRVPLSDKAL